MEGGWGFEGWVRGVFRREELVGSHEGIFGLKY